MASNERPPGKNIVDVTIAVHIVEVRTCAVLDKEWLPAHSAKGAHWRVHAAREQLLGLLEEFD
jgi:hypothetical protein